MVVHRIIVFNRCGCLKGLLLQFLSVTPYTKMLYFTILILTEAFPFNFAMCQVEKCGYFSFLFFSEVGDNLEISEISNVSTLSLWRLYHIANLLTITLIAAKVMP